MTENDTRAFALNDRGFSHSFCYLMLLFFLLFNVIEQSQTALLLDVIRCYLMPPLSRLPPHIRLGIVFDTRGVEGCFREGMGGFLGRLRSLKSLGRRLRRIGGGVQRKKNSCAVQRFTLLRHYP